MGRPRIVIRHGSLAAEAWLLDRIDALLAEAVDDPRLLAAPVRVVVPSAALRDHLLAAVVRRRGRAAAGLSVETLFGTAREILERAGAGPVAGDTLLEVLGWRTLRRHPDTAAELAALGDVSVTAAATLRDLVDAGLTPDHLPAVTERLAELGDTRVVRRARALAEVAATVTPALAAVGAGNAHLLATACALLADERALLPARAVLVHGFAEATALATDLIEALLHDGGEIVVDHPPDPADVRTTDTGADYTARLVWRLGGVAEAGGAPPRAPALVLLRAPGAEAEVRAVAQRIGTLLEGGAAPESITVAARDLGPYRIPLRRHFTRLGVPFSARGETVAGTPAGRRLRALAELLRAGREAASERWLDAWSGAPAGVELRLGLRAVGAGRLGAVATLDPDAVLVDGTLPLPMRTGIVDDPDPGDEGPAPRLPRRHLSGDRLRDAVAVAHRTVALLDGWPESVSLSRHVSRALALLDGLRWGDDDAGRLARTAVGSLTRDVPADIELGRDEALRLLRRALEDAGRAPLGGAGAGVRVLSVIEARATTAEHLFLLGLNRGTFPRVVAEDPLLPDWIRERLRDVLPDMPVKATGHDEDRFLFAELLSAAPRVTVSWQGSDDDGRPRTPSPLVERLLIAGRTATEVPTLWGDPAALRPAWEHAVLAGLSGDRDAFTAVLPTALAEAGAPRATAQPRRRILDELDPEPWAGTLGPFFGFAGPAGDTIPAVTTVERIATCPWQAFLTRLLRLEPPPDPLAALPGLDPLLVGTALHALVEAVVRAAAGDLPADLEAVLARPPAAVEWPADPRLRETVAEVARSVAAAAGVAHLAAPLAARLHRYVPLLRDTLWPGGEPAAVLGCEVRGRVEASPGVRISFRADLVEDTPDGPRLTDLKSSRPPHGQKKEETRHRHLLEDVATGRRLQAAAYTLSTAGATGRYVFVGDPDRERDGRTLAVAAPAVRDPFVRATATALAAWTSGAFLPRLVEADGSEAPPACSHCEVHEACLQGDSGARRRLLRWASGPVPEDGPEAAARAVFDLREADPETTP